MHPSILLIDDSPGECELFRQAMEQAGYHGRLDIVADSPAAWELLDKLSPEERPMVILLDLKLRGETGCDFLRKLKHSSCYSHTPVVILTTSDDAADVRSCYQAGASGYVIKPGCFEALVTQVRHIWKFWVECNCLVRNLSSC